MGKPVVPFIATPLHTSFGQHYMSAHSLWRGATTRQLQVVSSPSINSVLPANFNDLLCAALNRREELGITHFAMLHGDIVPQIGWFDILFDEMCASKADIISAIVPIKNADGWTSTAIGNRQPDGRQRNFKLSMRDIFELPETFGIEDTPWADSGDYLLLNTGCMMCSIDRRWRIKRRGRWPVEWRRLFYRVSGKQSRPIPPRHSRPDRAGVHGHAPMDRQDAF